MAIGNGSELERAVPESQNLRDAVEEHQTGGGWNWMPKSRPSPARIPEISRKENHLNNDGAGDRI
jgi:hypothetical protein